MNNPLTLGSLFSGSGTFEMAGILSGITPVWASEIEPFPIAVTRKRLPFMKHYGDISKLNGAELPPVDIITFGSPCTDLSVAGKRAGIQAERSGLFFEAIRVIKEMRCKTNGEYPKYIVWENVPGAFSSGGGEDFRCVLEEICKIADESATVPKPAKWHNAGEIMAGHYSVAYRLFDAQYWGVPQRRKRIYLVADFTGECAGKILFESEGMSGYSAEGFRAWQRAAGGAADCVGASGFDGYNGSLTGDVVSTLGTNCGMSSGRTGIVLNGSTPHHIAEILTFKNIPTPGGKEVWTTSTIESILTNEKYRGSALLQKKFTVDFLTKKVKINEGEVPQYYVEESHPAIIPPEEFELVQAEYLRRKRLGRKYNSKSIFTARLICECCGGYYGSKVWHSTSKYRRVVWQCNHKFQNGEKCTTPHLYEEHIKEKFILAMNRILENKDEIIENCLLLSKNFTTSDDSAIEKATQEMDVVAELTRNLIQQNSVKPMKQELYRAEYEQLVQRYESLKAKRDTLVSKKEAMESKLKFILHYAETLRGQDAITEFSEDLWLKTIDHVTVCKDGGMVFRFRDGTEIAV